MDLLSKMKPAGWLDIELDIEQRVEAGEIEYCACCDFTGICDCTVKGHDICIQCEGKKFISYD